MLTIKRFLRGLIPDEKLYPYEDGVPEYSDNPPRSVKYWSFLVTTVNALMAAVAVGILHNAAPIIVFLIFFFAGPVYVLMCWRDLTRWADFIDFQQRSPLLRPLWPTARTLAISLEWMIVISLILESVLMIGMLILVYSWKQ